MPNLSEFLLMLALFIFNKNWVKSADCVHKRINAGHNDHGPVLASFIVPDDTLRQVVYHQTPQRDSGFVREETVSTLKVQVKDAVAHQTLSEATVDMFMNHTLIGSAVTDSDGSALFHVPYIQGRALTLVASQDGYIHTSLPWKTSKMPRYRSIELKAVAAVIVQLLYKGGDVPVMGPIQITLPLHESSQSQHLDAVPAWSFDRKTGAWVNRGLGIVRMENGRLVWVYVAPHLGYWLAAPFAPASGYMGHESPLDLISHHMYSLMAILSGTLVIAIGLFAVVLCYCRGFLCMSDKKGINHTKIAVQKRDETTCTNNDDHQDLLFRDPEPHEEISPSVVSPGTCQRQQPVNSNMELECSTCVGETETSSLQIYEDTNGMAPESSKHSHLHMYVNSNKIVMPVSLKENIFLPEKLFVCNQPVAIFHMLDQSSPSEHTSGVRSATLPRKAIQDDSIEKPVSKNTFIQTLPKTQLLSDSQQQAITETPYRDPGLSNNPGAWSCFNSLSESVSVPEALNEALGMDTLCGSHQGSSEQTLLELSKSKPLPHARAWFVSLEGTPAAQVRHSIVDLHRSSLLVNSHDTSLDSGVDLNDQHSGRKHGQWHVRSTANLRDRCMEDVDLSSSESGATASCTPEELSLHSSSGTIANLPKERDNVDTSGEHEASECAAGPRVQRLRRTRVEKLKRTWHIREDRPLMKLN
ncbi:protein FAM171B-like isoform X2 [Electrophorus electricus]|uniref:protein FAM171B-like isoform X2 n=1 Tax=Electrophorus electricus TaxID=8005 RepID=UPI0015D06D38|nr:protein FAM171B-like isoform X2 [Electrophorus electricus]